MKLLLFFLCVHILRNTSAANCRFEAEDESYIQNVPKDDTETTLFAELTAVNIDAVAIDYTVGTPEYFVIEYDEPILKIRPSERFAQYEENTASAAGTHEITLSLLLTCHSESVPISLTFGQPIRDTNTHPPELSSSYEYEIPMPFPQGIDLTLFGEDILAKDIDITNTRVNFAIEPEGDFIIDYDVTIGDLNKEHRAFIKSARPLRLTEAKTYTITATDVGNPTLHATANLEITIDESLSMPRSPIFSKPYYIAKYDSSTTPHEIDVPTLLLSDGSTAALELEGEYREYFTIERGETGDLIINLVTELSDDVLRDNTFLPVTVSATVDNAEFVGRTVLIVQLPIQEQTTTTSEPCPTTVTITTVEPCPTTAEITTCEPCNTCEPVTDCTTTTDFDCSQCPTSTASSCEPCTSTTPGEPGCDLECCEDICSDICTPTDCSTTTVGVTTCSPEDCSEICTTTATPTDCPPCSTTTVSDTSCTPEDCEICSTPTTCPPQDCSTCSTTTVTACSCGPEDCEEICSTTSTITTPTETCPPQDCTTTTVTDSSCSPEDCEDICGTSPTCTPTDCQTTTGASCTPEDCQDICSTTQAPCVTTPTIDTCPPQDCTDCPTECQDGSSTTLFTCPPLDCSECPPTTAEPQPSGNIQFGQAVYTISVKPFEAFSEVFAATSEPQEEISYVLTSSSGSLPVTLSFDEATGSLSCTGLESNLYQFTIIATGHTSGHSANAGIIISVQSVEICGDEPRTMHSLFVTKVQENTEAIIYHKGSSSELADYTYTIESVYPEVQDLFYIDANGDLHCNDLDREWEGLLGMPNPQFTISLKLVESNSVAGPMYKSSAEHFKHLVSNNVNRDTEYRECVYINNIVNLPDAVVVSLIVTDANDNIPQFAEDRVIVGYPVKDLASVIAPYYLLQVQATDADSGDNAVVRYSVDSERVMIHSKTGVIYPSDNMFENENDFVFSVSAVDISEEGSDLEVEVKFVGQDYISVLTINNLLLEDMESKLEEILRDKGVHIRPLTASVLPMDALTRSPVTNLVITAYALSTSNELIDTAELKELLDDVNGLSVGELADECPPTVCTTTTTTTAEPGVTDPSLGNIQFGETIYTITAAPGEEFSEAIEATAVPAEDILYDLSPGSLPLGLKFDPVTATISSTGLESNLYQFTITATGQSSGQSAKAGVIISIQSAEVCGDEARTSYSVYVAEVPENTEAMIYHKGLDSKLNEYKYAIDSVYPTINQDLFYINDETGDLHCRKLDREWSGFAGMLYPQFTIRLNLVDIDEPVTATYTSTVDVFKQLVNKYANRDVEYRQCIYIENFIHNLPNVMVLSLVVTDDNDNMPQFPKDKIIVGYPVKDLASLISPAYLLQVKATDADSGVNAVVKYSVDNNRVIIHSDTGVIYPSDNMFEDDDGDDFDFTVKAVDVSQQGSDLEVEVKFLKQDYISVLTLKALLLEDMESKLDDILSVTNVHIKPLTASVLPTDALSRSLRDTPDTNLVITAYALSTKDELIKTSDLQRLLANVNGLSASKLQEYTQNPSPSDESSNSGLIAAVSVLAVLLVLAIIGFIAFIYFRKRKNNKYSQMEENGSNEAKPSFNKNTKIDFGSKPELNVHDRRPTGITFTQPVPDETDADAHTLKIDEDLRERRKSVTFNSNIEQIDIERDAETDKNGSVSVRL